MPHAARPAGRRLAATFQAATAFLVVLIAVVLPAGAAHAAGITVAGDGNDPGIAVDATGTGHIAFKSAASRDYPTTYDYSYCRLPRGATTCAPRTRLLTPGNLGPSGRARVLVDATRVIVLGNICCGGAEGVYAWTSTNGGTSFGAAKKVSDDMWVGEAILGPGDNSVSYIDYVRTGGLQWATGSLTPASPAVSPFAIGAGVNDGSDVDAYADLALLNPTTPFAVMVGGSKVFLRRFDSTKSGFNTAASWLPAQLVADAADDPSAASGPSGAFIGYETETYKDGGYPYAVRRVSEDGSIGPVTEVGAEGANVFDPDLAQDASGRLFVAYKDNRQDNRLYYQWSKRGITWSDPIPLSDPGEDSVYLPTVGVAPDGGGWVVVGSANYLTPIRVYPFGPKGDEDPVPTPKPGTPPTPPPPACPAQIAVSTTVKAMVRSGACFKDLGKGKFSTTGSVRVNGIDFAAPGTSGTFTVDTKAHTVAAKGPYTVQAGSIKLQQGSRTWNVTQVQKVEDLSAFGVKLFGLPIKGTADVSFDAQGAILQVNVELPSPFSGVRGITKLRTTMADGLKLSGLTIQADTLPIGPVELRNLSIVYTGENDGLEGRVEVYLPPAAGKAITAGFGIANGAFKHAELEASAPLTPLPLPLWASPPITLNKVGFAAKNDETGFRLSGGVLIAAGAAISGLTPVSIDALPSSGGGAFLFIPKKGGYAEIGASGKIAILDIPVAYGGMSIRTDGPLTFKGGANIDFEIIDINVLIEGGINLSNADFYAGGKGSACATLLNLSGCAKVSAILSSIGFAVCGSLEGTEKLTGASVSIGLGYDRKWKGSGNLGDCKYDEYKPASLTGSGARARQLAAGGVVSRLQAPGGAQTIVLPGGEGRGVRVKGAGALPGFTFVGPGGRSITVPAGQKEPSVGGNVAAIPVGPDEVELQVKQPAGSWTLTPAAGSTVTSVSTAAQLPTPKLSGRVGKAGGRARTLTVKSANLGGQTLIVREVLPGGGTAELGTVKRAGTTTLRFTPTDGPDGKRTIEAVLVNGDRQVGTQPITTYVAPVPGKLPAPRSVSLKRSKTGLTVRWKKVVGAGRYRIRVTGSDGRQQILTAAAKASSIKIADLTADDKVVVKVSAVTKFGAEGKRRAATSKAQKKAKKKR